MTWLHWLMHSWATVRDTGWVEYQQCSVCGKRRVLRGGIGRPVDHHWLATGGWSPPPVPPEGGSALLPKPPAFTARVRYVYTGPMPPMEYEL